MDTKRTLGSMLALLTAASTFAGSLAYGAPITVQGINSKTILQSGSTTIDLHDGNNHLDKSVRFTCTSAIGCVVVMNESALLNYGPRNGLLQICSFVDGVQGTPCQWGGYLEVNPYVYFTHEQLNVATGTHIVETLVNNEGEQGQKSGDQILSWETDYTIYEQ